MKGLANWGGSGVVANRGYLLGLCSKKEDAEGYGCSRY